jgi:hypothetical protein
MFVAMTMETSWLSRGAGNSSFHCIKIATNPVYPLSGTSIEKKEYKVVFKKWAEETKVDADGYCNEHKDKKVKTFALSVLERQQRKRRSKST